VDVDRLRGLGGDEERVAVGRRRRRRLRADLAFRTGLVVDPTAWPVRLAISDPTVRATMSVAVPGPNGTTMRIGFVGYSCAATGVASAMAIPASKPSIRMSRLYASRLGGVA